MFCGYVGNVLGSIMHISLSFPKLTYFSIIGISFHRYWWDLWTIVEASFSSTNHSRFELFFCIDNEIVSRLEKYLYKGSISIKIDKITEQMR